MQIVKKRLITIKTWNYISWSSKNNTLSDNATIRIGFRYSCTQGGITKKIITQLQRHDNA